jgi:hypothetical protein
MALSISKLWLTLRIEEDSANGSLHAVATDGNKTAVSAIDVELDKKFLRLLRKVMKDNAEAVENIALEHLVQSLGIDREDAPPPGVIAIKLDGGITSETAPIRVRKSPAAEEGDTE